MNITVDMMKKVNAGIASKKYVTMQEVADQCALDPSVLEAAVDSLEAEITTMDMLFEALSKYLEELSGRLKMMLECYRAIQKLQIDNEVIYISDEHPDPAIIWRG